MQETFPLLSERYEEITSAPLPKGQREHADNLMSSILTSMGPFPAHHAPKLVPHDLDDLMAGSQTFQHLLADGLLTNAIQKLLDDLKVDVGLKQGQPHFL